MSIESDEPSEQTELAGVADADTMSAYAWSMADDDSDVATGGDRPFIITAVAVGVSLALVTVASVLAYRHITDEPTPTTVVTAQPTASTDVPVSPPPVTVTTVVIESKEAAPPPPPPPPTVARIQSTWSYEVSWGGAPMLPVIEHARGETRTRYIGNGMNPGVGTGWTGEVVGVDPVLNDSITWAGCRLYVDGELVKADSATRGDGHDVSCLVRLVH